MTMFTAESRNRQLLCGGGYGGGYAEGFGGYDCETSSCIGRGSDLAVVGLSSSIMAEEDQEERAAESSSNSKDTNIVTTNIVHHHHHHHHQNRQEDRERGDDDEGWLQLGIGVGNVSQYKRDHHSSSAPPNDTTRNNGSPLIELELLPGNSSSNNNNNNINSSSCSQMRPLGSLIPEFRATRPPVMNFSPSGFFLQQHPSASTTNFPHHQYQEINWGFRPPIPISIGPSSSSSLSSFLTPSSGLSYFSRPFQLYSGVDMGPGGPGFDFRVIQPPRRPHSGLWFMLQASQNQEKEPYLPQISKSYLRIKDGRMTIQVVIKYLVNKLRLENESEIEVRCKGQRLVPFLTLQHVRDNIWSSSNSPRDLITLLPNSSAADHIMVLHYGRTAAAD